MLHLRSPDLRIIKAGHTEPGGLGGQGTDQEHPCHHLLIYVLGAGSIFFCKTV